MKKFMYLFALVLSLSVASATSADAQNLVRNNTACDFTIKIVYGNLATCTQLGVITMTVPPFSIAPMPIPAITQPLYAKGNYTAALGTPFGCPFYVAETCAGGPTSDNVICNTFCGSYTASLITGFGIFIN